jgi:hypothetical protein
MFVGMQDCILWKQKCFLRDYNEFRTQFLIPIFLSFRLPVFSRSGFLLRVNELNNNQDTILY